MQTLFFLLLWILPGLAGRQETNPEILAEETVIEHEDTWLEAYEIYQEMKLGEVIDLNAFQKAYAGFTKIDEKTKNILTLIDFSKPSGEERLYVLDMDTREMLHRSLVSHGKNSGMTYANSFSNTVNSYQSSLGFFVTESTYNGRNGYSLVLNGLEEGINDKAKERAIVMHGSKYVIPAAAQKNGRVGRSLGCPALPYAVTKPIINTIKNGSVLFIYAENEEYFKKSELVPAPVELPDAGQPSLY